MKIAAVLAACLIAPVVWAGECKVESATLPVQVVQNRVVAIARINGLAMPMLVSTSADFSMLQPDVVQALKLPLEMLPFGTRLSGNGENLEAQTAHVDRVNLGNINFSGITFAVADLRLGPHLKGVIGRDLIAVGDIEYDLARGFVRLVMPKGDCEHHHPVYWAGDAPVIEVPMLAPRNRRDKMIRVPVSINDRTVTAMLSTGSAHTLLSLGAARKAGISKDRLVPVADSGPASAWMADIESFQFGGERITHQRLGVEDFASEADFGMTLGVDYLLAHRVYVSFLRGKVYATWNGGAVFTPREGAVENNFDASFAAVSASSDQADADAIASRAAQAVSERDFSLAIFLMDGVIASKPDVPAYLLIRAEAHDGAGQTELALSDTNEMLRMNPESVDALLMRAYVLARTPAGHDAAFADLARVDGLVRRDANLRASMAVAYGRIGRVPEALRQWDAWFETHPRDAQLGRSYRQRCLLRTGRDLELGLALRDCERAVELDAESPMAHAALGWTRLRMGDLPRAKDAFDSAISLKSDHATARYGRAMYWRQEGDAQRSQEDAAAARRSAPRIDEQIRGMGLPTMPVEP